MRKVLFFLGLGALIAPISVSIYAADSKSPPLKAPSENNSKSPAVKAPSENNSKGPAVKPPSDNNRFQPLNPNQKHTITLYKSNNCPYCDIVSEYLTSIGKKIHTKNIDEQSSARRELVKIGGRAAVPCLIIDGDIVIYDSSSIKQWIAVNKNFLDNKK